MLRSSKILAGLLFCFLASSLFAQTWTKELAKGVTLTQQVVDSRKPLVVNIVTIDPKASGVRIKAVVAGDKVIKSDATKGRETVSSMARRLNAVVAINADFFPYTGDMLSLHITDGEIVSEPWPGRVVFGITSDGCALFDKVGFVGKVSLPDGRSFDVRGVNRPRGKNEIVLYTPRYGESTGTSKEGVEVIVKLANSAVKIGSQVTGVVSDVLPKSGDTVIPSGCVVLSGAGMASLPLTNWLSVGTPVSMEFKLNGVSTSGWDKVVEAVGGGPWLLKNGEKFIDAEDEGFSSSFSRTSHPRTAVGATADGKIIFATVDGRQSISSGISLDSLADLMKSFGCVNAINLDGGGSTTIATSWGVLNSPSDGSERPVANGLAVFGETVEVATEIPDFTIIPPDSPIYVGSVVSLGLVDACGKPLQDDLCNHALWAIVGGAGFVDQSGRFFGLREQSCQVIAKIGNKVASLPLRVTSTPVYKMVAELENDPSGEVNKSILRITVTDRDGKPCEGRKVEIFVVGGSSDCSVVTTSSEGTALAVITWDSTYPGIQQVTLVSEGLSPVVVQRSNLENKPGTKLSN